jgi:hypothetical protein
VAHIQRLPRLKAGNLPFEEDSTVLKDTMLRPISVNELENQTAFELPARETPGALVYISCSGPCVNVGPTTVVVEDINVAQNVCAQVITLLSALKCKAIAL